MVVLALHSDPARADPDLEFFERKLSPTLTQALVALCSARPADPLQWLAKWLLDHRQAPPIKSQALPTAVNWPDMAYIVDCGSGHTQVRAYGHDPAAHGRIVEKPSEKLTDESRVLIENGDKGVSVKLDAVLKLDTDGSAINNFLTLLEGALAQHGYVAGSSAPIYIGATGGVRSALISAPALQLKLDELKAALEAAPIGRTARFEMISGEEEGRLEAEACSLVFGPFFAAAGHPRVAMLSAGGNSVQLAWEAGGTKHSCSLRMPTKDEALVTALKEAATPEGRRALLDGARASYDSEANTHRESLRTCSQTPAWVGITTFAMIAAIAGFSEQWLTPATLRPRLLAIVDELCVRSETDGSGWRMAKAKWKDRVSYLWPILGLGAMRMLAVLSLVADDSSLYFAKAPPAAGGMEEEQKAPPVVVWSLGVYAELLARRESIRSISE